MNQLLSAPPTAAPRPRSTTNSAEATAVHPGWLTMKFEPAPEQPDVDDTVRFTAFLDLMRAAGALDRAATDVLADIGLTAGAFAALLELALAGDRGLAPSELSRQRSIARRTATLYVDILTKQGWVERIEHPEDRRMVLARLTPKGQHLLEQSGQEFRRRLAALLADVPADQCLQLSEILVPVAPSAGHDRAEDPAKP